MKFLFRPTQLVAEAPLARVFGLQDVSGQGG